MLLKSKDNDMAKKVAAAVTAPTAAHRQILLAGVAGTVASGLVASGSEMVNTAGDIADIAVDVAEAILKRVGL
jgi:hypothetical protein